MREIKFRAWDKKEKKYYYDVCYHEYEGIVFLNLPTGYGDWDGWKCDIDNCIIEQYTGLKDSTGKEIYEGDILNTKITFEDNMADRRYQDKTMIIVGFLNGVFVDLNTGVSIAEKIKCIVHKKIYYEIMGNIHE